MECIVSMWLCNVSISVWRGEKQHQWPDCSGHYCFVESSTFNCIILASSVPLSLLIQAASDVLKGLNELNQHLDTSPYLVGNSLTEVDLKNFAWVTRHDYAYTVIFKSPGGRITQYPNIASYVKKLVTDYPALLDTVDMPDACGSYYRQLFMLNFGRLVPYIPSIREWVAAL